MDRILMISTLLVVVTASVVMVMSVDDAGRFIASHESASGTIEQSIDAREHREDLICHERARGNRTVGVKQNTEAARLALWVRAEVPDGSPETDKIDLCYGSLGMTDRLEVERFIVLVLPPSPGSTPGRGVRQLDNTGRVGSSDPKGGEGVFNEGENER